MSRRVTSTLLTATAFVLCGSVAVASASVHPQHGVGGATTWSKLSCANVALSGPADAIKGSYGQTLAPLDTDGLNTGAAITYDWFQSSNPPTFYGDLDPPVAWTVENVPRTIYVQWQVPSTGGGVEWTPVDTIHAWSTCRAHFRLFHVQEAATHTIIRWNTDRAAPASELLVIVDGNTVDELDTAPIAHRLILPPVCSGVHTVDLFIRNGRDALASTMGDGRSVHVTGQASTSCLG